MEKCILFKNGDIAFFYLDDPYIWVDEQNEVIAAPYYLEFKNGSFLQNGRSCFFCENEPFLPLFERIEAMFDNRNKLKKYLIEKRAKQ